MPPCVLAEQHANAALRARGAARYRRPTCARLPNRGAMQAAKAHHVAVPQTVAELPRLGGRRTGMRRSVGWLSTFASVVMLLGCSHENDHAGPRHPGESSRDVDLSGTFRTAGGPAPGVDLLLTGTVRFEGPVTREVTSGADGNFTIELPPGTYSVVGTPSPEDRSAPSNCPSLGVVVKASSKATVEVLCFYA
jgi:hypothetical protein